MILLLFAALTTTQAASPAPPAAKVTTLETATGQAPAAPGNADQLKLTTLADDRLTLPVTIGSAGPFRFLVDTGADGSAVSRQLAERLLLPAGRRTKLHSVTGFDEVATASVRGLRVANRAMPDIDAPLLEAQHVGADGILGTDVLRSALVRFDFKKKLLTILPNERAAKRLDPDTIVVEARKREGRLIVTHALLDGQRLTVILDTGSEVSIGNMALRAALAKRRMLSGLAPLDLRSVTGTILPASYMTVRELDVGNVGFQNLGIAFADAHTFRALGFDDSPALLLGMNALRAFDSVTIDMNAKKLRFSKPESQRYRVDQYVMTGPRPRG